LVGGGRSLSLGTQERFYETVFSGNGAFSVLKVIFGIPDSPAVDQLLLRNPRFGSF
jgi:hypothetical protein